MMSSLYVSCLKWGKDADHGPQHSWFESGNKVLLHVAPPPPSTVSFHYGYKNTLSKNVSNTNLSFVLYYLQWTSLHYKTLITNPWISENLLCQSSIHTTGQANTVHAFAFEVLACGNPTHNLEVVSTPKPTTITLLLAMSIFSQSRLGVCERLLFLSWSVLLSYCNMPLMSVLLRHRPRCQKPPNCLDPRAPSVQ